jgi:hypothetical protein
MKKTYWKSLLLLLVLIALTVTAVMAGSGSAAAELASDGPGATAPGPIAQPVAPFVPSGGILYDNGPLITNPGAGAGGADASALQTALGMNVYGFGHALTTGYRVADDFTVTDPNGWQVDSFVFYAYQTGSTTASTINHINFRIWNGAPNAGGTIVFGDTTTNRFASSQWSNIYRARDIALTESTRPIMASVATAGVVLPPGTYWVDWQTGGTLGSGPWAPAITIAGSTAVGNGLQYNASTWAALIDTGTAAAQQGLPFQVIGSAGGSPSIALTKTVGTDPGSCATTTSISVDYGSTVYYCYTVVNTGNVTLTHHTVTDSILGTVLGPDFVYTLVPSASAFITESYVLMTNTVTNDALWTASISGTNTVATATASATVTGLPTDVSLSSIAGQTSGSFILIALMAGLVLLAGAVIVVRHQQS